jgi:hypothetical protein
MVEAANDKSWRLLILYLMLFQLTLWSGIGIVYAARSDPVKYTIVRENWTQRLETYDGLSNLVEKVCFENDDCNILSFENYCCNSACCNILQFIAHDRFDKNKAV